MNFDLSDDQRMLSEQVDDYLRDTCPVDRLHKAFDGDTEIADTIWRGMLDLGLGGVLAPEDHGGLGLGLMGTAAISERIGYAGAPGPWLSHVLATHAIAQAGTDKQKADWLPGLASGEIVASIALMEDDKWCPADWTLAGPGQAAGHKDYVMGLAEADVFVVGLSGGGLGLVRKGSGVTATPWSSTDKTRPVGRLTLDDAAIELLPEAFGEELVNAALILLAADAHGGSVRVRDDIVEYSKTRIQFDRPIAQFQAVKHKLADLAAFMELNNAYWRHAAAIVVEDASIAALTASHAKAHITETFADSARIATEAYGGIGYTWEHWAHIWLRRAMFDYGWLGTPAAHRARASSMQGW